MITLRRATAADQEAIVALVHAAQINPMDLKWPNFVVAVDDATGAIVAAGQVKGHRDGTRELASIVTGPAHRGRGLAHQIIEHLLRDNPGELYLTCMDTMGPFYEQFGFQIVEPPDLPPYFRRLLKLAGVFMFLTAEGRKLLVMKRESKG